MLILKKIFKTEFMDKERIVGALVYIPEYKSCEVKDIDDIYTMCKYRTTSNFTIRKSNNMYYFVGKNGIKISDIPVEYVGQKKVFIIGNGDVVQNRLKPALLKNGYRQSDILVYDIGNPKDSDKYCVYCENNDEIIDNILKRKKYNSVIYISTPSDTHFYYLDRFVKLGLQNIIIEKPCVSTLNEVNMVEKFVSDYFIRTRLFFLSYYILEKALPLYYLVSHNTNFEPYLEVEHLRNLKNWRNRLGVLKSVNVTIVEGQDNREWAFDNEKGGQMLETFIHNLLIASLFCGVPSEWRNCKLDNIGDTYILNANKDNAEIYLKMVKNETDNGKFNRFARFEFSNGYIYADLDKKEVKVYFNDNGRTSIIFVRKEYDYKYGVLANLVNDFVSGKCVSSEIDGLINQLEVIRWILKNKL